jgi:hypothetical protein
MYLTQLNPGTGALRLPSATHRAFTSFGFARSNTGAVAITLLFIAGLVESSFNSMTLSPVQPNAPSDRYLGRRQGK